MKKKTVVLLSLAAAIALCTAWIASSGTDEPLPSERTVRTSAEARAEQEKPSDFSERSPAPSASVANEASGVEPAAVSGQATAPSGQATGYASPLNIPLRLSANYGELRGGHFHAGIDIKTQGVIGKPVFAMDDGYVSRINVSPSGFGKALYITHPDGRMTVYGHLERFTEPIEAYVHELQYARKTFALDFAPPETRFPVKRGERIGLSGNRGSSGGPHLHLEVQKSGVYVDPTAYFG